MCNPTDHPIDLLAESADKAAFLADAINALSDDPRAELTRTGLAGLGRYLLDLERTLKHIYQTQTMTEV